MKYTATYAIDYGDYSSHNEVINYELVPMCKSVKVEVESSMSESLYNSFQESANDLANSHIPNPETGETRVDLIKLVNDYGEKLEFSPISSVKKTGMSELKYAS